MNECFEMRAWNGVGRTAHVTAVGHLQKSAAVPVGGGVRSIVLAPAGAPASAFSQNSLCDCGSGAKQELGTRFHPAVQRSCCS